MNNGIWNAIGAYLVWGLLPIYWKALQVVPAGQILSHRVVWSFMFLMGIILARKDWSAFRRAISSGRMVLIYTLAACLLAVNWLTYIWGVNAGYIVETSLGYFINPLVSVLLGVIFLRERLRPFQWLPIGMAAIAVVYLTLSVGSLPWIALVLALSFGLYGLLKKVAPLGSLHGLGLETGILVVPCLVYLGWAELQGIGAFGHVNVTEHSLLVFTGIVTAMPLLFFANAARSINLSTLGVLQYMAPTMQFLIGVLLYNEPFTPARVVGFGLIWIALAIYTTEGLIVRRRAEISTAAK